MFRANNKSLTHNDLVIEMMSMVEDAHLWAAKGLNNSQILAESLSYLFRNRKSTLYSNAQEFIKALDEHLLKNNLRYNQAFQPILDRIVANFFELHQKGSINTALGNLIARAIDNNLDAKQQLRHQLKHQQSLPNLLLIMEGINPGMTSIRTNLKRLLAFEAAEAAEALAEQERIHQQAIDDQATQSILAAAKLQLQIAQLRTESESPRAAPLMIQTLRSEPLSPIIEESTPAVSFARIAPPLVAVAASIQHEEKAEEYDSDSSISEHNERLEVQHYIDTTDDESSDSPQTEETSSPVAPLNLQRSRSFWLDDQLDHAEEEEEVAQYVTITQVVPSAQANTDIPSIIQPSASLDEVKGEAQQPHDNVDETAAKINALNDCFNDLNWWNGKTSYKFLSGGTHLKVGDTEKRVPHHIAVFKNSINHPVTEAGINDLIAAAEKQIPVANQGFSLGRLFQSPPGTRFCGLFQVRSAPMVSLIDTVAKFKTLSLAELTAALKQIRGNTDWQPIHDVVKPKQQIRPGK